MYIYSSLKVVDKFIYLGSSVSSTETDIDTWLAKHRQLSISYRLYGSQTWPIKWSAVPSKQGPCRYCYMDAPHGRLLNVWRKSLTAILNKSWRQHSTKQRPPITKTIQIRRTRHAGPCWRSRDELISDVLLWTPSHRRAKVGRPARTYIQQLCVDTGCSLDDLPEAMDNREEWREKVRNIRADSVTSWWYIYIYTKKNRFANDSKFCI